ncbi:MAG: Holliday junction branch migration protein RuvA [Acidimicrobiia bacterium]|nr:Holliday junction branch migration protein RuvA [Acidimicrobiia bacterium]
MIGRVRGTVVAKHGDRVVVDVAGIGYEIAVTPRTLVELPSLGDEAVLHTHLHVREDLLALFGFTTDDARDLFRILLGVSGIGPKVALAILGTLTPEALRLAVVTEDADALTQVPGIGKRSAQKLMLELRPKLDLPDAELPGSSSAGAEVREALEGLGYQAAEIRDVMRDLDPALPVEDLLRVALQELGRARQA